MAIWKWLTNDSECGICRLPFDGCCPDCRLPGDDCSLGKCIVSLAHPLYVRGWGGGGGGGGRGEGG